MKLSLALALSLKTASATNWQLTCENRCQVPGKWDPLLCDKCRDSPVEGKSSTGFFLPEGMGGCYVAGICNGCGGNAAARSVCTTLKRGMACPNCRESCKARLADGTLTACACPTECSQCVAKSWTNSIKKNCWYCEGHGRTTKLLPKFNLNDKVLFRFPVCNACGLCKNRITNGIVNEDGGNSFTQWFIGKIVKDRTYGYMSDPLYTIAPQKDQPTLYLPTGWEETVNKGKPFYLNKSGQPWTLADGTKVPHGKGTHTRPPLCENDIKGCESVHVDNILPHNDHTIGLPYLTRDELAAASPAGGIERQETDTSLSLSPEADEEKDQNKPAPKPFEGVDDILQPGDFSLLTPDRRRLQNLIKRFQRASLQCQFGNNN